MWSTIWKEKITSVRELRLPQFNYKLLYKLHMSNEYLHRWKLVKSSSCYKCNCLEDYYHLFYDCEYSSSFWNKFIKIFFKLDIIQAEMKVEFKDIIVGKDGGSNSKLLSFYNMISLGTYVLFREKRKLKFEHIFETFVEEVKWRSTTRKESLWKICI